MAEPRRSRSVLSQSCGHTARVSLLPDYSNQAQSYDRTRGASPVIVAHLRAALAGAPGRHLADIGGGTGNYADALRAEGFEPLVIDRSPEMLAHARAKGLSTLLADAQRLPCEEGCFDAAMLVSMLHHVEDRAAAVNEAARVLCRGGRLAIMLFTREDIDDLWLLDYFPSTRGWMEATHPPVGEVLAPLPGRAA